MERRALLDGPEYMEGYGHGKDVCLVKDVVQVLLGQLDPEGFYMQKCHRLRRRVYRNEGPNVAWHADGYDKSKPYEFAIHWCIDGWSRKVLWLIVTRSILITSRRVFWRLLKNMADAQ